MHRALLALLLGAGLIMAQTESPVVGVGPFLHIVSDLDQSLAFYHGKLGLELTGPAGEHKFTDNPAVANLYGVPGKQFRAAVLKIPGSAMGIELVQWGEARKPKGEPIAGPGVATLILRPTRAARKSSARSGWIPGRSGAIGKSGRADLSVSVSDVGNDRRRSTYGVLGLKSGPNPIHQGDRLATAGRSIS